MFPIGIVTKDRPELLDVTLKSLSGSNTCGAPVVVFDDGSETLAAYSHLYAKAPAKLFATNKPGQLPAGNGLVPFSNSIDCLGGLVETVRISEESVGVWNASLFALRYLNAKFPKAEGFVLLQDDLLFRPDWFEILSFWARNAPKKTGIISGLTVVHCQAFPSELTQVDNVTAQCLWISKRLLIDSEGFFAQTTLQRSCFDSALCYAAKEAGFSVRLIYPYLARHIGNESTVRPGHYWQTEKPTDLSGPFAWAGKVKRFFEKDGEQ